MKRHPTHEIARSMLGELRGTAQDVARALAPPDKASDGEVVARQRFLEEVRHGFATEGAPYLARLRDRMAPVAITTAAGQLRAKHGLDAFNSLVADALPELYAAAHLLEDNPTATVAPSPAAPYGGA